MLRCYITDRQAIGGEDALLRNIERLGNEIDFLQIRERDLPSRDLALLVRKAMRVAGSAVRVLVNDRTDIALACGAHGVHLRSNAIPAAAVRQIAAPGFVISVACHSFEEVVAAERSGADLAVVSPIYTVSGKGPAMGVAGLREITERCGIPVLALGGLRDDLVADCLNVGAAGVAGIRLFQEPGWVSRA